MLFIEVFSSEHQAGVIALIVPIQQWEFCIDISAKVQRDLHKIDASYQSSNGQSWVRLNDDREVISSTALLDIGQQQVTLRKMFVQANYRGKPLCTAESTADVVAQPPGWRFVWLLWHPAGADQPALSYGLNKILPERPAVKEASIAALY